MSAPNSLLILAIRATRLATVALLIALALPAAASAQEPYSPLVPGGMLRLSIRGDYLTFSQRFGTATDNVEDDALRSLSELFAGVIGPTTFPTLTSFEDAVQTAADMAYTANFGSLDVAIEKSSARVPLSLDAGVFDWLTVGATVPLIKNQTEFLGFFSADSASVNAGFSPGLDNGSLVATFLAGLRSSVTRYDSFRATTCEADPNSPLCVEATAIAAAALAFHGSLATMYDSGMAPLVWSEAGIALQARLLRFREAFRAVGVATSSGDVPLSNTPLTADDLPTLLSDPRFGIEASYPLEEWTPLWALGDIEFRADANLFQAGDPESSRQLTLGAGALVRLPTGTQDDPTNFLDMGTGDGQTDVELRGWMNGRSGQFGLWLDLRYGLQMKGSTERRVFDDAFAITPSWSQAKLEWDPGDYQSVEVAPWFQPNEAFSVVAGFRYFSKGKDRFILAEGVLPNGDAAVPDPNILVAGSEMWSSEYTVGMVYNRAGNGGHGGRSAGQPTSDTQLPSDDYPLEIRALYRSVFMGQGVPAAETIEVQFRLFRRLWGG